MKGVAEMEGNIWLLGAVAWPFLAAFISLLAGKKGERNRDVFASAAMVMEFTGMLCLYPVNSPAAAGTFVLKLVKPVMAFATEALAPCSSKPVAITVMVASS